MREEDEKFTVREKYFVIFRAASDIIRTQIHGVKTKLSEAFWDSKRFDEKSYRLHAPLVRAHLKERSPFRIFELNNVVWWNEVKGLTGGAQMLQIFEKGFEIFFNVQDQYS